MANWNSIEREASACKEAKMCALINPLCFLHVLVRRPR